MKKDVMILSKEIALLYLLNEFPNFSLKVTTILDDEECWTGKVILETADKNVKTNDSEYLKNIYGKYE